ncbi:MAG TPA: hypothetical protein VNI83_06695 [Vicinamibacterales bacterium]|nr:hypothetical protein [Vicinamibacterales bacterium]
MALRIVGLVLIIGGIVALAIGGIPYTRERTVIDVGPVEARAETREEFRIPAVASLAAIAAGVVLVVLPSRRRA